MDGPFKTTNVSDLYISFLLIVDTSYIFVLGGDFDTESLKYIEN